MRGIPTTTGTASSYPPLGEARTSQHNLTAPVGSSSDSTVWYSWFYTRAKTGTTVLLAMQLENTLTTYLEAGEAANGYNLVVYSEVSDPDGLANPCVAPAVLGQWSVKHLRLT